MVSNLVVSDIVELLISFGDLFPGLFLILEVNIIVVAHSILL